jgi:DNA-binding NarL/FixJ family response regulator
MGFEWSFGTQSWLTMIRLFKTSFRTC